MIKTVYTGVSPRHLSRVFVSTSTSIKTNSSRLFLASDPSHWTTSHVAHWLTWAEREFSIEGIQLENLKMAGKHLLSLGRDAFIARTPPYAGEILWEHLETLQKGKTNRMTSHD